MSDDCWCDYEPAEFCAKRVSKARKRYRCQECGRAIEAGERYEYVFGKWEGYVDEIKTCLRCLEIRRYVQEMVPCFCWAYGNMWDDARETIERYRGELPGLWFGWARRQIAAQNGPKWVSA